ncbi:MAG: phosphatidylserine decarboxylase, partial [Thermoplasmata archaeon]
LLETSIGKVKIVQIAGIIARRIVPYIREGQEVKKGERIGIIRLGSRVDLYLPKKKVELKVKEGENVYAGSSVLARILQEVKD